MGGEGVCIRWRPFDLQDWYIIMLHISLKVDLLVLIMNEWSENSKPQSVYLNISTYTIFN